MTVGTSPNDAEIYTFEKIMNGHVKNAHLLAYAKRR